MNRKEFLQKSALAGGLLMVNPTQLFGSSPSFNSNFPTVRVPVSARHFTSGVVEDVIKEFSKNVKDKELVWLFNNCFPNTLDTTVTYKEKAGRPDTYVITGDIDAMWLRDSSAQVFPYLAFVKKDKKLKDLIAGVVNRQTEQILKDPYANAFYDDPNKTGEWASDHTKMLPGVHERKFEVDSLCYPIRLGYHYWKETADKTPFDASWVQAMKAILQVFKEQQCKNGYGPYSFQRNTPNGTDTRSLKGFGYPVKPVGLIASAFRPSDDSSVFSFLVPSNFFAVESLKQAAEMLRALHHDTTTSAEMEALAQEVSQALKEHAVVTHKKYGQVYAFEVDGYGGQVIMDDANVPSLLALPYLGAIDAKDPVYQNTRKLILSLDNPFFFKGKAAEGIGGPHVGMDMIWPMAIIMRAFTTSDENEIKACIQSLKATHGDTGFMHESFHKDDPKNFTRSWFAWTNTLFGELLWETYKHRPHLLT
ncbi:glycoside hydrolase family 125 protein [Chryseobacterium sp. A321]